MAEEEGFDLEKPARDLTKGVLAGIWEWLFGKSGSETGAAPSRGILIIGSNGTGKSTLARFLAGGLNWLDADAREYRESLSIERLSDDSDVEIVVAPGQDFRRPSTWPELKSQIATGAYRGVIVMNAYGYHNFSTSSYKYHDLYEGSLPAFWDSYRENRRKEELRVVRELVPHLSVCPKRLWLLSVVAKQDLWEGQQQAAEEHYLRGDYARVVSPVLGALGGRQFRHETAFVSLILLNLETLGREELARTEAGYDVAKQVASIRRLMGLFADLKAWERAE